MNLIVPALVAVVIGLFIGFTFRVLSLPVPVPSTFAGTLAACGSILGMYLGTVLGGSHP